MALGRIRSALGTIAKLIGLFILGIIALAIIGGLLVGGGGDGGGSDATPTPTVSTQTHEIGETFTVGSGNQAVEYEVIEYQTLGVLEGPVSTTEPDGVFLVVTVSMTNVGDETFDITDRHLKVVDDQDRSFDADFQASVTASDDPRVEPDGISFEQLNPGLEITRAVVFDVNPGATYSLRIEPVGVFSTADPHRVPLGTASVNETAN